MYHQFILVNFRRKKLKIDGFDTIRSKADPSNGSFVDDVLNQRTLAK